MKKIKCENQVAVVAYHEAGHAVVALALGSRIISVEIEPKWLTRCHYERNENGQTNRTLTALSGPAAERRACGMPDDATAAWHID